MTKRRWILFRILLVLIVSAVAALVLTSLLHPVRYINPEGYALTVSVPYLEDNEVAEEEILIPRGTAVSLRQSGTSTSVISWQGKTLQVPTSVLAETLEECVDENQVWVRRTVNLREEKDGGLSDTVARKGEVLKVLSAGAEDLDPETGMVKWYEVSKGGISWWVPGDYVETDPAVLDEYDGSGTLYSRYWDAFYGDGYSQWAFIESLDWKPADQTVFEDNPVPEEVKGFHVMMDALMADPEYYLDLLETTEMNTIVIELKNEKGQVMYDSGIPSQYMADDAGVTNPAVSVEELAAIMKRLNDAGYYTIARISTFKDAFFSEQNPSEALLDADGGLLEIAGSTWASPYSRKAWEYNVVLALEAAQWFDEIQLDYVRFPEGLAQLDGEYEDQNTTDESKAGVIQNFTNYARDAVHETGTYLSVDVFALTVNANDDQDLGQFVPGLLVVSDAVSPMPYADHFAAGSFGIEAPWDEPGETVRRFTQSAGNVFVNEYQYRPWIQGYSVTASEIADQIQAIKDNGYDSWLIWTPTGSAQDLEAAVKATSIPTDEK